MTARMTDRAIPRRRNHRPGPWLDDLRRMHANGYSDARIASELSDKYCPLWWTKLNVYYWRRHPIYVNLPATQGKVTMKEWRVTTAVRQQQRRNYQAKMGWGHLLPWWDHETKREVPGFELSRVEVDILSLLAEEGPSPVRRLQVGLDRPLGRGVGRLVGWKLVVVEHGTKTARGRFTPAVYRLGVMPERSERGWRLTGNTVALTRHVRTFRPDKWELQARALARLMRESREAHEAFMAGEPLDTSPDENSTDEVSDLD